MNENRHVDFSSDTVDKITEAIGSILAGTCSKVEVNKTTKVYECKNVIRIDLKITEDK